MRMKNSNDTIGNRTRDLPACSEMPQPTVPPRAPLQGLKLWIVQTVAYLKCRLRYPVTFVPLTSEQLNIQAYSAEQNSADGNVAAFIKIYRGNLLKWHSGRAKETRTQTQGQFNGQISSYYIYIYIYIYIYTHRVIHKSLRDFRTRLRNNQDRHGRKEHINR